MRKPRLYLDTSVWNFLFAADAPEKKAVTERLFVEIAEGKYEIHISDAVINEIEAAPTEKINSVLKRIEIHKPRFLLRDENTDFLIKTYLEFEILSEKHILDVVHIAVASSNGMDILLSWNMKHIARKKTKILVNIANKSVGFKELEIMTPEELIEDEND
jgi:predicted nucleic acid-binding protein